jgi:hypothetical protein
MSTAQNRREFLGAAAVGLAARVRARAQSAPPEGLPDVLRMSNGAKITRAADWNGKRRPELLELFAREMYGRAPSRPKEMNFRQVEAATPALGGAAIRKQVRVSFTGEPGGPGMDLLFYLPHVLPHVPPQAAKGPFPAILGMNVWGNHAVAADPGIRLTSSWMESGKNPFIDLSCVAGNRATEACRGINARQWPVEKILSRGYALVTVYRGDIDPDRSDGLASSVRARYPELQQGDDNFSTIGAWAWAFSRALDYLETDRDIDARRVAVFGWSRLGKAALWAGATDQRFAMVLSNESGAGGAKLFRRGVGENIRRLNTVFPHWYCRNFRKYNDLDTTLPFDQHMVIALSAPRPVYIASAERDTGADPEGEFWAAKAAEPVYRLLGKDGLPADRWPPVNQPVFGQMGYHVRTGGHDVTEFDWTQYLVFADRHLGDRKQP